MKKHYHLGTQNGTFEEGTQPEGWELGMYLSPESRKKLSDKMIGNNNPMKNPETSKKVGEAQRGEKSFKYGTHESAEAKLKNSLAHRGDKNAMKRKEVSSKVSAKLKGNIPVNKGKTKEDTEYIRIGTEKSTKSRQIFYESVDKSYYEPIKEKRKESIRKNNSFNCSKAEERMYTKLTSIFQPQDVVRQYSDSRYNFACDFYIKSLDIFIECNFHWTHGFHQFNKDCQKDIEQLELWKNKNTRYYSNAIYVWTQLDPKKQMIALQNKLNYFCFYTEIDMENWMTSYNVGHLPDEDALKIIDQKELDLLNLLEKS